MRPGVFGCLQATFLTSAEQARLAERDARRRAHGGESTLASQMRQAVLDYRTWHLIAMLTVGNVPKYGLQPFSPWEEMSRVWHLLQLPADKLGFSRTACCFLHRWAILYWCPLIVDGLLGGDKEKPANPSLVAVLSGLPFAASAAFIAGNAYHSRKSGECLLFWLYLPALNPDFAHGLWNELWQGPINMIHLQGRQKVMALAICNAEE